MNPLLLTANVFPLARLMFASENVPSPAVLVFCPASETLAPLKGCRVAAASTLPLTASPPARDCKSTVKTGDVAELVAAWADGKARPCAAHHETSNGKPRCLGIQLVVFIKLLGLPDVKAAQRKFSVVIHPGGSEWSSGAEARTCLGQ
jgi:hypothetical protein